MRALFLILLVIVIGFLCVQSHASAGTMLVLALAILAVVGLFKSLE